MATACLQKRNGSMPQGEKAKRLSPLGTMSMIRMHTVIMRMGITITLPATG